MDSSKGWPTAPTLAERRETLELLLARLSEAGEQMPTFKKGETQLVLLELDGEPWTLSNFMAAMTSERNPAEIRELDDLRRFARRLYALKVLLPRHAREIGIHEAERVAKGIETTRRQALVERIRQIKVLETLNPSKEEIRAYYEAHKDLYVREERISILEILVDTRAQADSLLAAIERGGDLGELARRYSRRSTRIRRAEGRIQLLRPDKYGNLGWEAKDAEVGQIVGPGQDRAGLYGLQGAQQGAQSPAELGRGLGPSARPLAPRPDPRALRCVAGQTQESVRRPDSHLRGPPAQREFLIPAYHQ